MFVHPDPDIDAALIEAVYSSIRDITDHVYFDWDGDGLFAHELSDLSPVVDEVQLEHPTLTTDQPQDINAFVGYSSAELTVSLGGRRYNDEDTIDVLLSRFNVPGPFYNRDLTGTRIKYEQRVRTSKGEVDIRRFTGWMSDIQIKHGDGSVSITATNAAPWLSNIITLPHWAVEADIPASTYDAGAMRPINASWVFGEAMRAAGTPLAPIERSDCIASVSGMGSMLPSIGEHDNGSNYYLGNDPHFLCNQALPLISSETPSGQGPFLFRTQGTDGDVNRKFHSNTFLTDRTQGQTKVPRRGTSDPNVNIGFQLMALSNGNTTNSTTQKIGSGTIVGLSFSLLNQADIVVAVHSNGQVFCTVYSSNDTYVWGWTYKPAGWHHYDVNVRFTPSSIDVVLTVDGVDQGARSYGSGANNGFEYVANTFPQWTYPPTGKPWAGAGTVGNRVAIEQYDPAQHYRIYTGPPATAVFHPSDRVVPTTVDGLPWAEFYACASELSFIPDTTNESVWSVLQSLATAEFATLVINNYGQIVYKPRYITAQDSLSAQTKYNSDNVLDLITNPSLDQYRNQIYVEYVDTKQTPTTVWKNDSPFSLYAPSNSYAAGQQVFYTFENPADTMVSAVYLPAQVCSYSDAPEQTSTSGSTTAAKATPWQINMRGTYTAVGAGSGGTAGPWTNDAMDPNHNGDTLDWAYSSCFVVPGAKGRTIEIGVGSISGWNQYIGAGVVDASSPSGSLPATTLNVRGKAYAPKQTTTYFAQDSAEVASRGAAVLQISAYDWRQTSGTASLVATYLLPEVTKPAPTISGLKIPMDPRLEIGDKILVDPGKAFSSPITVQIVGMQESASDRSMSIDGRITETPSTWTLGIVGASELGVHTYLG